MSKTFITELMCMKKNGYFLTKDIELCSLAMLPFCSHLRHTIQGFNFAPLSIVPDSDK